METILVMMPYIQSKAQGNEIKICLNCWRKFCTFNYHFVVVGDYAEDLQKEFPWVEFIYCEPKKLMEAQYNPHLDIQHKMEVLYNKYHKEYTGFIRVSDDVYAIKPFTLDDITTVYYNSDKLNPYPSPNHPTNYFSNNKWKTQQLLIKNNLPIVNYTIHSPYYYEFEKLMEIWNKYDMRNESYVLEDIYFNSFEHSEPKPITDIRCMIRLKSKVYEKFHYSLNSPNIKFLCNSNSGWTSEIEKILLK